MKEGGGITFFARDYWYNRWDTGWWFFGVNALFESFNLFVTCHKKTHPSATKATRLVLLGGGKCAKSALKQSDSVANVQGTGRCTGLSWETAVQTLIPTYCIYKALWIRFKGHTSSLSQPPQSGRNIGYLGKNSIRITYREKKTKLIII